MNFWMIFLLLTTLLFCGLFVLVLVLGLRTSRRLRALEKLYADTILDIQSASGIFHSLVNRSMLSDDPDVQKVKHVFAVTLDILNEYLRVGGQVARFVASSEAEEGNIDAYMLNISSGENNINEQHTVASETEEKER